MSRAVETADLIHKYLPGLSLDRDNILQEGAPIKPEPYLLMWRPESYVGLFCKYFFSLFTFMMVNTFAAASFLLRLPEESGHFGLCITNLRFVLYYMHLEYKADTEIVMVSHPFFHFHFDQLVTV